MRILLPILVLLLAACDDRDADAGDVEGAAGSAAPPAAGTSGPDLAALQALIDRAITRAMPGGATARYRNVRAGTGGAACGEVALQSAVFRPFVVSRDAIAIIAEGPTIAFEDPSDSVADAWIRWCATPEELLALEPQLRSAAMTPAAEIESNMAALPELELPSAAPPPPAAASKPPRPSAPPPAPQIDSFFNSVQRPDP
jgi:hypothetical protein